MSNSPFQSKTYTDIRDELRDQIINGIVKIINEEFTATGVGPYTLTLGSIDGATLVEVNRVWGVKDESFKEFAEIVDYTVDLDNAQITFESAKDPDADTNFYVDYKYDQGFKTGLTDLSEGSVLSVVTSSVARQLADNYSSLEEVLAAAQIDYSLGDDLDELVKILGVTRNAASKATGDATFYRDSTSGEQNINAGTKIGTVGSVGNPVVLFETTTQVTFRDGFSYVRAPIQAATGYEGKKGNVRAGTITQLIGSSPASKVSNPVEYWNNEFVDLIDGVYTYTLGYFPRRTFTSQSSVALIGNYVDQDVSDWTTSNATITADTPDSGVTKIVNDGGDGIGYIEITGLSVVRATYPDLAILVRGTVGNNIRISYQYDDSTWVQSSSIPCTLDWSLEQVAAASGTNITGIRIYPYETNSTIYVDFAIIGKQMTERTDVTQQNQLTNDYEFLVNYSGKLFGLRYVDESNNFFQTYSESDELLLYYLSLNYISGGTDEETDDQLRLRARNALEVAAKGTKAAIRNAVLDVDGVWRCTVTDHDDDSNIPLGKVNCFVMSQGYTISQALQQDIIDAVDATRAAGIRVDIFQPTIRYTNFNLTLTYDDSREEFGTQAGRDALRSECVSVVNDHFGDINIGEDLQFTYLIGRVITEVDGIIGGYVEWGNVKLDYDNQSGGEFTVGNTITGGTSGATAKIVADDPSGTAGTLTLTDITANFEDDEQITEGSVTADVDGLLYGDPEISDDDFSGTYIWDVDAILDDPKRIKAQETDETVVVQRGNISDTNMITLEGKSTK